MNIQKENKPKAAGIKVQTSITAGLSSCSKARQTSPVFKGQNVTTNTLRGDHQA